MDVRESIASASGRCEVHLMPEFRRFTVEWLTAVLLPVFIPAAFLLDPRPRAHLANPLAWVFLLGLLHSLSMAFVRVRADDRKIAITYGIGWPRVEIDYRDIVDCWVEKSLDNWLIYGWYRERGMLRRWTYPVPWLSAVELVVSAAGGGYREYRIPTRDANGLLSFLQAHLRARRESSTSAVLPE